MPSVHEILTCGRYSINLVSFCRLKYKVLKMSRELVDAYWCAVIMFDSLCTLLGKLFSVVAAFGVWGASQNNFCYCLISSPDHVLLQLSVASGGYGVHVHPKLILI